MKRRKIAKRKEIKKMIAITSTLVILLLISTGYGAFQTSINIQVQGTVNKCKIGRTWKYEYTGEPKEFKAPCGGTYKIELWGASGGRTTANNGYGGSTSSWSGDGPASGGGSGYYGGGAGAGSSGNGKQGMSGGSGGGGSSFISGHEGCDAIDKFSTEDNIIHTGRSVHYSGLYFNETEIIDGSGYKWTDHKLEDLGIVGMPTHSGIGTMIGNNGNGYAKITLLSKNWIKSIKKNQYKIEIYWFFNIITSKKYN